MRKLLIFALLTGIVSFSCNKIKNKSKEAVNKSGEVVGQTASKFFEGVSEGVKETFELKINLSESLKAKGISVGKTSVSSDTNCVNNNLLTVYFIAKNDFNSEIAFKAYDKNKVEIGRSKIRVALDKGEAKYYDIKFDKRTDLELKSIIEIE